MKTMKYYTILSVVAASLAVAATAQGQEINIGVSCDEIDYDVNEITRLAADQTWLNNTYEATIKEQINFDEFEGWTVTGGFHDFAGNQVSPYHKFVLGTMLVIDGVNGPPVPVREVSGFWGYDNAAFYVGANHNLDYEYWKLARTDSIQACLNVDQSDGTSLCVDNEPDGWSIWARAYFANVYYGDQEIVRLRGAFSDPTTWANYPDDLEVIEDENEVYGYYLATPVNYACPTFNSNRGVARIAGTIVHENFHGPSSVGHLDCARGNGRCADEWNFDMPTEPRTYNSLPTNTLVDPYQVEQRFLCDVVEEPDDWVPLMVQNVFNARANDRAGQNIFQNIEGPDPTDPGETIVTGLAPLSCGTPTNTFGSTLVTCTAANSCTDATDCAAGNSCNDGCCVPATCSTAGGTTCSSSADCSSIETCDANSCCVPLACPNPAGQTVCETTADCGDFQTCIDGCCFINPT